MFTVFPDLSELKDKLDLLERQIGPAILKSEEDTDIADTISAIKDKISSVKSDDMYYFVNSFKEVVTVEDKEAEFERSSIEEESTDDELAEVSEEDSESNGDEGDREV
jgi:hypothetical protein